MTVALVVYPADSPEDNADAVEALILMERALRGTVAEMTQHFVGELVGGFPSDSMFQGDGSRCELCDQEPVLHWIQLTGLGGVNAGANCTRRLWGD